VYSPHFAAQIQMMLFAVRTLATCLAANSCGQFGWQLARVASRTAAVSVKGGAMTDQRDWLSEPSCPMVCVVLLASCRTLCTTGYVMSMTALLLLSPAVTWTC
jgi:hypothetical protein